jgi:hypothetical protein
LGDTTAEQGVRGYGRKREREVYGMGSFSETTSLRLSWMAATTKHVQAWRFFLGSSAGYMKRGFGSSSTGTEKGYTTLMMMMTT